MVITVIGAYHIELAKDALTRVNGKQANRLKWRLISFFIHGSTVRVLYCLTVLLQKSGLAIPEYAKTFLNQFWEISTIRHIQKCLLYSIYVLNTNYLQSKLPKFVSVTWRYLIFRFSKTVRRKNLKVIIHNSFRELKRVHLTTPILKCHQITSSIA